MSKEQDTQARDKHEGNYQNREQESNPFPGATGLRIRLTFGRFDAQIALSLVYQIVQVDRRRHHLSRGRIPRQHGRSQTDDLSENLSVL